MFLGLLAYFAFVHAFYVPYRVLILIYEHLEKIIILMKQFSFLA